MTARIVVLASGTGTNCQVLLDACASGTLDAEIAAVIANNPTALVIDRAKAAEVPAVVVEHKARDRDRRAAEDDALVATIQEFDPDLVVLAGWMRILGARLTSQLRIINLHPSLPGDLVGVDAIGRAFAEWQAGHRSSTGVMVHWVPDEGVDTGPPLVTETVSFLTSDTKDGFEKRMRAAEHRLIVDGTRLALTELENR